jgi:hypothetical protein
VVVSQDIRATSKCLDKYFSVQRKPLTAKKTRLKDFQRTSKGLVSFSETCNQVEHSVCEDWRSGWKLIHDFNFVRNIIQVLKTIMLQR